MSARVNIPVAGAVGPSKPAANSSKGAQMVLPNDMMHKCIGRVVLVLLSAPCGDHEAELVGKLAMVEEDGSVVLDECVHYAVIYPPSSGDAAGVLQRSVVRKCKRALVNTRYISCIIPQ